MNNIEQFSLYTAKIFNELYNSFPIPVNIVQSEIILDYLLFNKDDELQALKIKLDISSLLSEVGDHSKLELLPPISEKHDELDSEKKSEIEYQTKIFKNTLEFLVFEGLVRKAVGGSYVLTAKSFSHLNKSFANGKVNDEDSSYIKTIKSIFTRTTGVTEKIGVGVAVKVIPSLLGIN